MRTVSIKAWEIERAGEKRTIELLKTAIDEIKASRHLDQNERFALAQAGVMVFSVLDNFERRGEILKVNHFNSMSDSLKPGDEGYGQQ